MPDVKVITALRESGGGELVHEYDQGKDKRINELDITSDGWCLGVSVQWVKHKAAATDFWQWMAGPQAGPAMRFLMASQAVRVDKKASLKDVLERTTFTLKKEMKAAKQEIRQGPACTLQHLEDDFVKTPGKYAILFVQWQNGSGHFFAGSVEGDVVTFMDPNAGEMRFPHKAEFTKFLPKFWKAQNYSTNMTITIVDKLDKK